MDKTNGHLPDAGAVIYGLLSSGVLRGVVDLCVCVRGATAHRALDVGVLVRAGTAANATH